MNETSASTEETREASPKQKSKPSMLVAVWITVAVLNLYLVLNSVMTAVQVFTASEPATEVAKHEALFDVQYHSNIALVVFLMIGVACIVHGWGSNKFQ